MSRQHTYAESDAATADQGSNAQQADSGTFGVSYRSNNDEASSDNPLRDVERHQSGNTSSSSNEGDADSDKGTPSIPRRRSSVDNSPEGAVPAKHKPNLSANEVRILPASEIKRSPKVGAGARGIAPPSIFGRSGDSNNSSVLGPLPNLSDIHSNRTLIHWPSPSAGKNRAFGQSADTADERQSFLRARSEDGMQWSEREEEVLRQYEDSMGIANRPPQKKQPRVATAEPERKQTQRSIDSSPSSMTGTRFAVSASTNDSVESPISPHGTSTKAASSTTSTAEGNPRPSSGSDIPAPAATKKETQQGKKHPKSSAGQPRAQTGEANSSDAIRHAGAADDGDIHALPRTGSDTALQLRRAHSNIGTFAPTEEMAYVGTGLRSPTLPRSGNNMPGKAGSAPDFDYVEFSQHHKPRSLTPTRRHESMVSFEGVLPVDEHRAMTPTTRHPIHHQRRNSFNLGGNPYNRPLGDERGYAQTAAGTQRNRTLRRSGAVSTAVGSNRRVKFPSHGDDGSQQRDNRHNEWDNAAVRLASIIPPRGNFGRSLFPFSPNSTRRAHSMDLIGVPATITPTGGSLSLTGSFQGAPGAARSHVSSGSGSSGSRGGKYLKHGQSALDVSSDARTTSRMENTPHTVVSITRDSPRISPTGSGPREGTASAFPAKGGKNEEGRSLSESLSRHTAHQERQNPLHMIPWDMRSTLPTRGLGSNACSCCIAPKFWERVDWAARATLLAVLPTSIIAHHPDIRTQFALPGVLMDMAFWITSPNLGSGLRELVTALKGWTIALCLMAFYLLIDPRNEWAWLFVHFMFIFTVGVLAATQKKTVAFITAMIMVAHLSNPNSVDFKFLGNFFVDVLIGLCIGAFAFIFPIPNWSLVGAQESCTILGNAVSVAIQGLCSSFWCPSALERELNLIKIRQLRESMHQTIKIIDKRLEEADYEPHFALTVAQVAARRDVLETLTNIIRSTMQVIEIVAQNPQVIETPTCVAYGAMIGPPLAVLASAIDSYILKICDFGHPVSEYEVQQFRLAYDYFSGELETVREQCIIANSEYETDESDVYVGFFMFSIDEIASTVANFTLPQDAPSRLNVWLLAPFNDFYDVIKSLWDLAHGVVSGTLARDTKEAFKLALAMSLASGIQIVYETKDPLAGSSIIPWIWAPTSADAFNCSAMRLLGTVFGSIVAYILNEVADGNLAALLCMLNALVFCGAFVMTSTNYREAGSAVCWSAMSIVSLSKSRTDAVLRIQQNVFAILIYFAVTALLWPKKATGTISKEIDASLRSFRTAFCSMMNTIGDPSEVSDVIVEVSECIQGLRKSLSHQQQLIPIAVFEPTMLSIAFPEAQYRGINSSLDNLCSMLSMMRFAFFMCLSSHDVDSVHWQLISAITEECNALSDVLFAIVDMHLMSITRATSVPTQHLVKLRVSLLDINEQLFYNFTQALYHQITDPNIVIKDVKPPPKRSEDLHDAAARPAGEPSKDPSHTQKKEGSSDVDKGESTADETIRDDDIGASAKATVQEYRGDSSAPKKGTNDVAVASGVESSHSDIEGPKGSTSRDKKSNKVTTTGATTTSLSKKETTRIPLAAAAVTGQSPSTKGKDVSPPSKPSLATAAGISDIASDRASAGSLSDPPSDASNDVFDEMILSNSDIHSLEAFIFGIRAIVTELGQFQKQLLMVHHYEEMTVAM